MKFASKIFFIFLSISALAQREAENYGYRHFQIVFNNENVDI
ncbi:hypothetical protein J2W48_002923 [Flavobacterium piscis]|uniref:Uncharacterized protein n=1 Tax=Flavobacterium piscis TaxID=1114874 RepID=A0ABU1Y9S5_9FLAO|nr:hypothetical protein [Flavobacterium piscis]